MSFFYPQAAVVMDVRWENFGKKGDPLLSKNAELKVLAKRINVSINEYTEADTVNIELDYKNFPFDPRTVRAIGVQVHLADQERVFKPDNSLNEIVPSRANAIFQGFIDTENMSFDEQNRTITMEGRDYTSLFIDAPYTGKALDMGAPLDGLIQQLIGELPATAAITVENRTNAALPSLGAFAPGLTPLGRTRSGKKKESYWDVIQDLIQRASLIGYIELDKLVITKPRVLYGNEKPTQFIYGENLMKLSFKRKIGRQRGINVVVRSIDLEKKTVLEAKIPMEADPQWAADLGVESGKEAMIEKLDTNGQVVEEVAPYLAFNVPDIANIQQLKEIGQSIYEEIGRQQLEGELETKEMCQIQDGIKVDLTQVRAGTPIKIEIEQGDLEGLQRLTSIAERTRFLVNRCYEPKIAAAFAKTLGIFDTLFYTKSAELTLDKDNGFSMRLGFINFITNVNKGI